MKPKIGMTINDDRLGICVIIAVHVAGTIDVQAANGRCYRLTGLNF